MEISLIMKKIVIATPAYSGKVNVQYAIALSETVSLLEMHGFEVMIRISIGGSLLVADRNRILQMFWDTGADHLLMVDSDLGWNPQSVIRLIKAGKDISGGVYPSRKEGIFNFRPILEEDGRLEMCKLTGLLKMEYIPAGYLLISRSALSKMREKHPELAYSPKDERNKSEAAYCLFNTEVWDGEFWGEDYVFCRRAAQAGLEIWVDPLIEFDHDGKIGRLSDILTDDPSKSKSEHTLTT